MAEAQDFLNKLLSEAVTFLPEWRRDRESLEFMIFQALSNVLKEQQDQVDDGKTELYIPTAKQRESLIKIVRLVDYNPRGTVPARGSLSAPFDKTALQAFIDQGNDLFPAKEEFLVSFAGQSIKAFLEFDTVIPTIPSSSNSSGGLSNFMQVLSRSVSSPAEVTITAVDLPTGTANLLDATLPEPSDFRTAGLHLGEVGIRAGDVLRFVDPDPPGDVLEFKIASVPVGSKTLVISGYTKQSPIVIQDYTIRRRDKVLLSALGTETTLKTTYANVDVTGESRVYINNIQQDPNTEAAITADGTINLLVSLQPGSAVEADYALNSLDFTIVRARLPLIAGERKTEFFKGTGEDFQRFTLTGKPIIENSIEPVVDGRDFVIVTNFDQPFEISRRMCQIELTPDEFVQIVFPGADQGFVPGPGSGTDPSQKNIQIDYAVGGGKSTNVTSEAGVSYVGTILKGAGLDEEQLFLPSGMTGGDDPESNESIRVNAPSLSSTSGRAVTDLDYEIISEIFSGVHRAQALPDTVNNTARIYIVTKGPDGFIQAPSEALLTALKNHLDALSLLTVINSTLPAVSKTVHLRATFKTPIGSTLADGQEAVLEFFSEETAFGKTVTFGAFQIFMAAKGFNIAIGSQLWFGPAAPDPEGDSGVADVELQDNEFPFLESDIFTALKVKFLAPPI